MSSSGSSWVNQQAASGFKTHADVGRRGLEASVDTMDKAFITRELRSFECSSPSEPDRKLSDEQSLLSALSLESRALNDTAGEGCTSRAWDPASLCLSDAVSPSPLTSSNIHEPDGLAVPFQGHFSTPHILLHKPRAAGCFDHSYGDLTASQVCWDVSVIRAEGCSPREPEPSPRLSPCLKVDGCRRKTPEAGVAPEGTTMDE